MKLNAICMVKNEADIIQETLENALRFCDNIYVFDNGSTDATYEILQKMQMLDKRVIIAERSSETFRNQLRARIYNRYHHLYSEDDWWYLLDADEMIDENPKHKLLSANDSKCDLMRVWQAQFYFTDTDLKHYQYEDHRKKISLRRRHYKINWREIRFFRNDPKTKWLESTPGRVPAFCQKVYGPSPVCRHYAERTPEQIQKRIRCRKSNPFSFLHVKSKSNNDWLMSAAELKTYEPGEVLSVTLADKFNYYKGEIKFWLMHKLNHISAIKDKLATSINCV